MRVTTRADVGVPVYPKAFR